MEVIGSKMLYIGSSVPIAGVVGSIWINSATGAIYRCTSILPLTYTPSGILPPTNFTDFTDTDLWVPLNADPTNFVMSMAVTGVSLSSTKANGNPRSEDLFAGMISRGTFYPDPTTGLLSLAVLFDSVNPPTDLVALNDVFLLGMMVSIQNQNFANTYGSGFLTGFAKIQNTGPLKYQTTFGSVGVSTGSTPFQTTLSSGTGAAVSSGATFSITVNLAARTKSAGTIRSYGVTSWDVVGTGGIPTESMAAFGGVDANVPYGMPAILPGVKVALGMWPGHNSNQGSGRLIGFNLVNGYWHL